MATEWQDFEFARGEEKQFVFELPAGQDPTGFAMELTIRPNDFLQTATYVFTSASGRVTVNSDKAVVFTPTYNESKALGSTKTVEYFVFLERTDTGSRIEMAKARLHVRPAGGSLP
jgi:hypothetical protein